MAVTRVVRGWRLEQEPRRFHSVRTSPTTWRRHFFRRVAIKQADSLLSAWHQLPYVAYIERLAGVARQRIIYGHSSNVNDTCHYGFVVGC